MIKFSPINHALLTHQYKINFMQVEKKKTKMTFI